MKTNLLLVRYKTTNLVPNLTFTAGKLFWQNQFECYTLENPVRLKKIYGETAIPEGTYKIELYTKGKVHENYKQYYDKKYGKNWHKGVVLLRNVPEYLGVLIHVGNTLKDTDGCLLIGSKIDDEHGIIYNSRAAYENLYPKIRDDLLKGKEVNINIIEKQAENNNNNNVDNTNTKIPTVPEFESNIPDEIDVEDTIYLYRRKRNKNPLLTISIMVLVLILIITIYSKRKK